MNQRMSNFLKTAGPGVLFASTAIGVSHLIQSTRAGADYGLLIMGFVVLAVLLKYPFFEYGSRYANSTGTSIIDGYKKLGRPVLWMYFIITIGSIFFVTGAVGFVTAGFFENLFGVDHLDEWTMVILFSVCVTILAVGKYNAFDSLIKIVAVVLLVSTVAAFALALYHGPVEQVEGFVQKDLVTVSGLFFLLALMGWMPAPLELSSWNSLWTLERIKHSKYTPKMGETVFEFKIAYILTGVLAVMFVTLGSYIFFGSGEDLPNNNVDFAHQVITIYTNTMGEWTYVIISASAFAIMFGTIIAVFDGYTRSLTRTIELLFAKEGRIEGARSRVLYMGLLLMIAAGGLIVVFQFGSNLHALVDFATVLAFVIAPVIAVFNLRLVTGRFLPKADQPSLLMRAISVAGIVFLAGFASLFLASKFLF